MVKAISVLGCTGSIGRQTLAAAEHIGVRVAALTAQRKIDLLEQQARKYRPQFCAVYDEQAAKAFKTAVADTDIRVGVGMEGLLEAATLAESDCVVTAVSGAVGLKPTLAAIAEKKRIALANKETLVCAGELVMRAAKERGAEIVPVDSEHSAIFQCLMGRQPGELGKILLTGSGGPFRGRKRETLEAVTPEQAVAHPNWSMGAKITIDSATMMNKGLEIIEAGRLFEVSGEDIDVVVHRESIIHSLIEFTDNSVLAQLGLPDMRIPIQYAITYPMRYESPVGELDLAQIGKLTFFEPDYETFECLRACKKAFEMGGAATAIANGANEEANALFRQGKIKFLDIGRLVMGAVDNIANFTPACVQDILDVDEQARRYVRDRVN